MYCIRKGLVGLALLVYLVGCGGSDGGDEGASAVGAGTSARQVSGDSSSPTSGSADHSESRLIGKWDGDFDFPEPEDEFEKMALEMAKGFLANSWLEFKEGGRFEMNMMFPFEGTYAQEGSIISLTVDKAMGMTIDDLNELNEENDGEGEDFDQPMILELSKDGKRLTMLDDGSGSSDEGTLFFTRA